MKKNIFTSVLAAMLLSAVIGLGAAAYLGVTSKPAHAATPYSQTQVIARHFNSGAVAAGAIIQSPVLDLSNVSECIAYADNSAGGSTRALTADWMADDGTTVVFRASNTVAIAGRGLTTIAVTAQTASLPTGVVAIPGATGRKMQFTLAAAGAAAGSLNVDCR